MEMKRIGCFVGILLVGLLMLSLVAAAGYTVSVPAASSPGSSSSGGGGGGSSTLSGLTYNVNVAQLAAGYSRELSLNDRFRVSVSSEFYYVKLVGVTATTININVSNATQEVTLSVGDLRKFDVGDDGYYDLSVTLESINATSSKVVMMVKSIREEVIEEVSDDVEEVLGDVATGAAVGDVGDSEGGSWWIWVLVIVVIGVVVYFIKRER